MSEREEICVRLRGLLGGPEKVDLCEVLDALGFDGMSYRCLELEGVGLEVIPAVSTREVGRLADALGGGE